MPHGDVICLQQGSRGNYTGAHWWNLHAAYADVVEDPAYNASTVFYGSRSVSHPRVVCVDGKGSVRREPRHDIEEEPFELWEGAVQDVSGSATRSRSRDQRDDRKEYFGDFMSVLSEETRVHVLSTVQRWGSEERGWSVHGQRCPIHRDELESIDDSVRKLAEKSDSLAGFLYVVEDTGIWGNVASCVLEEMRDDYKGKTTMLFATRRGPNAYDGWDHVDRGGGHDEKEKTMRVLTEGLAVSTLSPLVDLYVPVYGRGGSIDGLFQSCLLGAMGIFGATMPLMSANASGIDMASLANGLSAGHHRCPLASLDVYSPALGAPMALSRHPRRGDVGRITEHVSILGMGSRRVHEAGDIDHDQRPSWFDLDDVSLARPRTRTVSEIGSGIPVVRGMDETLGLRLPTDRSSLLCASVLGSTKAFMPELRWLASMFEPKNLRDKACLLESWGVQGLRGEVHEELLSMADCFAESE